MNDQLFVQAVAAARAGRKAEARSLLRKVLNADRFNELAWLWYADCASTQEERIQDLEGCLRQNPYMPRVRAGLAALKKGKESDPGRTQPVLIDRTDEGGEPGNGDGFALPRLTLEDEWALSAGSAVFTISPDAISPEEFAAIEARAEALLLKRPRVKPQRQDDFWKSIETPVVPAYHDSRREGPPAVTASTITAALGLLLGFILLVMIGSI